MISKRFIIAATLVLALVSLACGITLTMPENAIQTGPPVTDLIQVPAPSSGNTAKIKQLQVILKDIAISVEDDI